jgi:predicted hotdog family 3-hydroxylacyl-ACP dehydratase
VKGGEMTTTNFDARPRPLHAMDEWVPHRGAMSLLDRIEHCADQSVVACVRVPADGLFSGPDGVPSWVGIEYMAQAIAAWSGARSRAGGGSPRIGFLLGSRRYEAHVPAFAVGAELRVSAESEMVGENGLGVFGCRITQGERVLATARLSVYEPPADGGDEQQGSPGQGDDAGKTSARERLDEGGSRR